MSDTKNKIKKMTVVKNKKPRARNIYDFKMIFKKGRIPVRITYIGSFFDKED